jgi:hypothetical protein
MELVDNADDRQLERAKIWVTQLEKCHDTLSFAKLGFL